MIYDDIWLVYSHPVSHPYWESFKLVNNSLLMSISICLYVFLFFSVYLVSFLCLHLRRPSPNSHLLDSDLILADDNGFDDHPHVLTVADVNRDLADLATPN